MIFILETMITFNRMRIIILMINMMITKYIILYKKKVQERIQNNLQKMTI
jgi:hypothetical protein